MLTKVISMRIIALAVALLGLASAAHAQGMNTYQPSPVFQAEGRQRTLISTTCVSNSWTLVASTDVISRSWLIQAPSGNTATVCLSSNTATDCAITTPGIELAPNTALTDYGHAKWYCESYSGTQYLKGYYTWDQADSGARSASNRQ